MMHDATVLAGSNFRGPFPSTTISMSMDSARSFGTCPIWNYEQEDFSACFQYRLSTVLPVLLVSVSVLLVALSWFRRPQRGIALSLEQDTTATANGGLAKSATQQVHERENAVILDELQSNPIDPVPPTVEAHIINLDLLRSIGQVFQGVVLLGVCTAAWASGATNLGTWELVWATAWAYFAAISAAAFVAPLHIYKHQCAIQFTYLAVMGINLRSLLIGSTPPSRTQLYLTSVEFATALLFALPVVFFPRRVTPSDQLERLYSLDGGIKSEAIAGIQDQAPVAPELTASFFSRL